MDLDDEMCYTACTMDSPDASLSAEWRKCHGGNKISMIKDVFPGLKVHFNRANTDRVYIPLVQLADMEHHLKRLSLRYY